MDVVWNNYLFIEQMIFFFRLSYLFDRIFIQIISNILQFYFRFHLSLDLSQYRYFFFLFK